MYIARSDGGTFKVVKNLGHIDPKECAVPLELNATPAYAEHHWRRERRYRHHVGTGVAASALVTSPGCRRSTSRRCPDQGP